MTHDELSIEVSRRLQVALYNGDIPAIHALKAIVELHKPFEIDREGNYNCQECEWAYPCPTVQTIEKELNG
jgi:hypothetical protein